MKGEDFIDRLNENSYWRVQLLGVNEIVLCVCSYQLCAWRPLLTKCRCSVLDGLVHCCLFLLCLAGPRRPVCTRVRMAETDSAPFQGPELPSPKQPWHSRSHWNHLPLEGRQELSYQMSIKWKNIVRMRNERRKLISFRKSIGPSRDVCTTTSHMNHSHVDDIKI